MAADGSIVIETRLDTDGIEQGLDEIERAVEGRLSAVENGARSLMDAISAAVGSADLSESAAALISSAADAILGGAGSLFSAALEAAGSAAAGLLGGTGLFGSGGAALSSAAAAGISGAAGAVASAARSSASGGAAAAASVSGQFSAVGANLMSALRSGIAAGASALYAKAASIAAGVVARLKGVFGIHSPSKVFRDEIGKMLMMGLADGILQNKEAVLAACEDLSADMLSSEKKYLAERERVEAEQDEADEARRVREYEKRLASAKDAAERDEIIAEERLRLKKRADDAYLAQLKKSSEREREIIDQLKDDITAIYKDIAEYAENGLEPIVKSRDKLSERLKKFAAETFGYGQTEFRFSVREETSVGAVKRREESVPVYYLADQRESIEALRGYSEALTELSGRLKESFSPETARSFMHALAELDVGEASVFARTLLGADDAAFGDYVEKWAEKNELAEAIASQLYSEEFTEAVDDCTDYMRAELEAVGLEAPEGFFASGAASAREFGRGFSEGLNKVLEDARSLIESFGGLGAAAGGAGGVVNNTNYYNSYSINGTKSTAAESIRAVEAAATMNKYRGLG